MATRLAATLAAIFATILILAAAIGAQPAFAASGGGATLAADAAGLAGMAASAGANARRMSKDDKADGSPDYYTIRPGDTLTVSVLEDPNLTQTVLVRPDGRISLPIAGSVDAENLSPERLERVLAQRFSRGFQVTPTVTVSVRSLAPEDPDQDGDYDEPLRFYVLGAANQAGAMQTIYEITVIEALAIAGGPSPFAAKNRIQLRRTDENGVETVTTFNYERLEEGLPLANNQIIENGDVIFIPERGLWD